MLQWMMDDLSNEELTHPDDGTEPLETERGAFGSCNTGAVGCSPVVMDAEASPATSATLG